MLWTLTSSLQQRRNASERRGGVCSLRLLCGCLSRFGVGTLRWFYFIFSSNGILGYHTNHVFFSMRSNKTEFYFKAYGGQVWRYDAGTVRSFRCDTPCSMAEVAWVSYKRWSICSASFLNPNDVEREMRLWVQVTMHRSNRTRHWIVNWYARPRPICFLLSKFTTSNYHSSLTQLSQFFPGYWHTRIESWLGRLWHVTASSTSIFLLFTFEPKSGFLSIRIASYDSNE